MVSTKRADAAWPAQFRNALLPLLLFASLFSIYFSTAAQDRVNIDAWAASAGSWRIATTGTPWLDGMDVTALPGTHDGVYWGDVWIAESPNGHVTPQRMAGPILAGVPFYLLFGDRGTEEEDFSLLPGAVAASSLTAAAGVLLFLALRRTTRLPIALAAVLVFALATPTWTISANGLWTHPVTQLGIAGAAYAASRDRWPAVGLWLGLGMLGRPHLALIAAVVGLGLAWSRRDWRIALQVALPTVSALGLLATWNRIVHGVWSVGGAYSGATERAAGGVGSNELDQEQLLNYLGFLFSFNRGFLIWTPVVLLFIPAVLRARRDLPDWSLWLPLGGALYTFFQLRLNHYTGGTYFYGYRHGLELLTCLVPALAFSVPHLGRVARQLVPVVVIGQFAAISIGAAVEGFFVDFEKAWTDNSLWLALQQNPVVVGTWLVASAAIALVVARRFAPEVKPTPPEGSAPSRGTDVARQ